MTTTTVAVLGLGAMGLPMARHLSATFPVSAYDIDPSRAAAAADVARVCSTAREAATHATVALVAVRNEEQLLDLLWGDAGIAPALGDGAVVLLTSTVGIEAVRAVAARLAADNVHLVDAPVSGGPARAGTGDLLVVVGADDAAWEAGLPVLEAMASTLVRVGERAGDGQAMKTVNQLLCGVHIAAAAEALALAGALGLDQATTLRTLMAGAAASFMLGDRGPRALQAFDDGGAEVRSRLDIFVKDMGIVAAAAREAHVATPVAGAAQALFLLGEAAGLGAEDDSSVIRLLGGHDHH
ncbi:MAG TPA: NAD(P)-dependent oxidoreductase [Propionibacteriaceae bacterium]|nr:NAD(P)-dependent oxidoreductase [Propionibacteriaceae bacterium]